MATENENAVVSIDNIQLQQQKDESHSEETNIAESNTAESNHNNGNVKEIVVDKAEGISCALAPATSYVTTKRDGAVKIRFSGGKGHPNAEPAISVMQLMENTCKKHPNKPALKVERQNTWVTWTYAEYLQDVKTTGKGFIKLGLEQYNGVGILGFNSPEWLFSDIGAIFAGGLATGIYTTNNPEACQYVCADARCNIVVVENDIQLQKILHIWDKLPQLKAIVQYTGELKDKKPNLYTWNELMEIGRAVDDSVLEERCHLQAPNKCCTLIYTSGTTGSPKGVMLSHDNIVSAAISVLHGITDVSAIDPSHQDVSISYLPLSHIAAQMTDIWLPIINSALIYFARPDALKGTLGQTLLAARPTLFVGVPRVFEKMEEKLKGIGANVHGLKKKVSTWAKGVGRRGNQNKEAGLSVPFGWTLANVLVFNKIHKALGLDRARAIFTAAAPISKQTLEYFQSLNLPLYEIYGMSEASGAITLNTPTKLRTCSIGPILYINEYKIVNPDDDGSGELCFRGRNVLMGYLENEEKTQETIDSDGWLHSGDVGKVDADDFFYITGRIKELIITAGGENIAPVPIEDNIKTEIPLIATAMVIGDKKKFLSCILTIQVEIDSDTGLPTDKLLPTALHYCSQLGLNVTKAQEIAPNVPEELKKAIQEGIDRANKKAVSNAQRVQKWKLLPLEFTTAGGELGPTQKLRRPQVMKMYKETIDEFYA